MCQNNLRGLAYLFRFFVMQPIFRLFFAFMLKSPHNNKTIDHVIIFICVKEKIMFAHFFFESAACIAACKQYVCVCLGRKIAISTNVKKIWMLFYMLGDYTTHLNFARYFLLKLVAANFPGKFVE